MVATVVVTTQAKPLGYPSQSMIDRNPGNGGTPGPGNPDVGSLFCVLRNTAGNYETFRSNDGGVSWATFGTPLVRANIQEWSGIYLDDNHYMHWCYRTNESSQDRLYYRKMPIQGGNAGVWDPEFLVQADGNGGVAGAVWTGLDLAVRHHATGTYIIVIAAGKTVGATNGVVLMGVSLDFTAGTYLNNQQIRTNRTWLATGSGRITPSIDFEHTGDARTSSTPHLWLAWGRAEARMVKLSWAGTLSGWNGPTGSIVLDSALGVSQDSMAARWDGERFLIAYPRPGSLDMVKVVERNRANTGQVVRQTPAHTQGNIRNVQIDWASNGDHRIWAVGTSTADLYYIDFVRATGLYGSWTLFSATDIIGSPPNQWSVRRGSYGNSRYDVLTAHATPSPNTILHTQQALAFSPTTPTWLSPANGAAADVAVSLVLDWQFNDVDPGDTQGSYALSRQVGAAALEYWRASDSTWQIAEVQNTGAATALTLTATQWSLDGTANGATDPPHTYKVKTWDATGLPSVYSAGLIVVPSAKVNPTIVTPTAAQVLATSSVTFTWTVAEQTAFRLQLTDSGIVKYDSGFITSTDLAFTPPYVLPDNTGWTGTLETRNLEGLTSNAITRSFTVDFIEPANPTIVATPSTINGYIAVAITNPAPSGGQPALTGQDLYRRPVTTVNGLINPGFEVDLTGWSPTFGTAVRSSTQFHDGGWAAFFTPDGVNTPTRLEGSVPGFLDAAEGQSWTVGGWIRPTTANKPAIIGLVWYTAAGAFISSSPGPPVPVLAGLWLYMTWAATAPATTGKIAARIGLSNTPAAGDTYYVDSMELRQTNQSAGIPIATGLASGATYNDWTAVARQAYEYRALALGANGASTYGPWTA